MTYLIDTQILLWFLLESDQLSASNYRLLSTGTNRILVSHVSIFEIAIKRKTGKLADLRLTVPELVARIKSDRFEVLEISERHLAAYDQIPLLPEHRDPFDRLLMATAHAEYLTLISADEKFCWYSTDLFRLIRNE